MSEGINFEGIYAKGLTSKGLLSDSRLGVSVRRLLREKEGQKGGPVEDQEEDLTRHQPSRERKKA